MRDLLHEATARHHVIMASNYPGDWMADVRSQFFPDVRADMCGSFELGVRKPSRGFYDRLADRSSLDPGRTVLVDDSPSNIEGAVAAGWQGVRYRDAGSTRKALAALGFQLGPS